MTLEKQIAEDYGMVLKEAKSMGCNKINALYNIPLDNMKSIVNALEEVQKYRAIGTPEECLAAVEKQIAKKPIRNDKCTCPSCGTYNEVIKKRRNTVYSDIVYCWHCGQALKIFRSDEE